MERLKEKTIWIGREPGQKRLLVALNVNGKVLSAPMGQAGCVPDCVSRCDMASGKAHCKIDVDKQGRMVLTNLKPENVTYVNGSSVASKQITNEVQVQLGMQKFSIHLVPILDVAKKLVGTLPPPAISIRHLEKVYDTYHEGVKKVRKEQKRINNYRSLYLPISMVGSLAGGVLFPGVGLVVGGILMAWCAYKGFTDKSDEKIEALRRQFEDDYICPNCKHNVGDRPYHILKQNKTCPYCKAEWLSD